MPDISLGGPGFVLIGLFWIGLLVAPLVWAFIIWRRLSYFGSWAKTVDYNLTRYFSMLRDDDRERMLLGLSAAILLLALAIYAAVQAGIIYRYGGLTNWLLPISLLSVIVIGLTQALNSATDYKELDNPDNAVLVVSRMIGLLPCFIYVAIFILKQLEVVTAFDNLDIFYISNLSISSLLLYILSPVIPLLVHRIVSPFRSAKPDVGN
jgi:hypothetical protein